MRKVLCRKLKRKLNPVPEDYMLYQNYPNPFNPTTTIQYDLVKSGNVLIKIYNLLGEEIKSLVNQYQNSGNIKLSLTVLIYPAVFISIEFL